MDNGWVKIHRKIQDWEWYEDSKMVHLFLHFLLLANHEPGKWQGQQIETGQFITGLDSLTERTGISTQSIRTCINKLKSTGEITSKSTNKFRIITLLKWKDYQTRPDISTSKSTGNLTDNQQTTNNQSTANKKNKNIRIKEDKNIAAEPPEVNELLDFFKKTVNEHINFGNKTERKACKDLIEKYGFSKTKEALTFLEEKRKTDKYLPLITTPYELWTKWAKIKQHLTTKKRKIWKPTSLSLPSLQGENTK